MPDGDAEELAPGISQGAQRKYHYKLGQLLSADPYSLGW